MTAWAEALGWVIVWIAVAGCEGSTDASAPATAPGPAPAPATAPAPAPAPGPAPAPATATATGPATGPATATAPAPDDFVDVHALDPTIRLDMRYAGARNFTKAAIYPVPRCLLRRAVAAKLIAVQAELRRAGLGLLLWDCYRPLDVQRKLWKLVPDPRYVAPVVERNGRVVEGSKHNRGAALDVTLVDRGGSQLPMPTDHDDFSKRAHRDYRGGDAVARRNMRRLEAAMQRHGFTGMPTEWWHFDGPGWRRYPLSNRPLAKPEPAGAHPRH